ncbi:hypothetical protein QVD99_002206 [Batrachochytrium dendrobatidis]|nr:hypothetical protein QVD99_002206 [Batrachochytrium dendrobatidis]
MVCTMITVQIYMSSSCITRFDDIDQLTHADQLNWCTLYAYGHDVWLINYIVIIDIDIIAQNMQYQHNSCKSLIINVTLWLNHGLYCIDSIDWITGQCAVMTDRVELSGKYY